MLMCSNNKIDARVVQQCFLSHAVWMVITERLPTRTHCMLIHERATWSSHSGSASTRLLHQMQMNNKCCGNIMCRFPLPPPPLPLRLPLPVFVLPPASPWLKLPPPSAGPQRTFPPPQRSLCGQLQPEVMFGGDTVDGAGSDWLEGWWMSVQAHRLLPRLRFCHHTVLSLIKYCQFETTVIKKCYYTPVDRRMYNGEVSIRLSINFHLSEPKLWVCSR